MKRLAIVLVVLLAPMLAFASPAGEVTAAKTEGPVVLTAFWRLDAKTGMTLKSYSEMTVFKELEKRTGVRLEFKHPPSGQENEQFNLMLASNNLTDLIYWDWWASVPGGPGQLIADGQIIRLNELFDKYAPNYLAYLKADPERRKQASLDDGTLYTIPKIKSDKYNRISDGFQVRQDWLDRIGAEKPTTIDGWYKMLSAIRKADANGNGKVGDEIPFSGTGLDKFSLRRFAFAWGVSWNFGLAGRKVVYGPIEPAYKDHLATMAKWYAEKLIDQDFVTNNDKNFESKVVGDIVASYAGNINGHMGKFLGLKQNDPSFKLVGIQPPIGPAGKAYGPMDSEMTGNAVVVSASCKNKEAAVRWGDYLFTKDGIMLTNFGVEGLTYTMQDGQPVLTDLIKKNPNKLPMINALSQHVWSASSGPGLQLERVFKQIQLPPQIDAVNLYQAVQDAGVLMPPAFPTPKEAERLSAIMTDIQTYADEMYCKFVLGQVPISDWDKYVATIRKMNIDEATAIWQGVVNRYDKR